ncbi:MAG: Flagellar hook-length control protein-like, C-terminal domain [Candidatus Gallionella acididurans]|uniref:Flagellar hook-length control protein-like, C-terminal domain n=1 Tax=Candidatus Gallionella acididurans TaxID=1796491 RepID=A0A139BXR1_9PROT|nr:MAG: Flagellar hook-length control protein-like, C-terminal domain [Candidatus Gallionella acididurans]
MQPTNLTNALQAVLRSGKPLVTAAADTAYPITKLEPGQQLQGSVQSRVSAGLFKVLVAGQSLQMRLPDNIRSGDLLNLQVISNKPQLTFGIFASSTPISTQEQISAAARIFSNLAELPLEQPIFRKLGGTAVWQTADTAPDSKQLAAALRDALANSGLFYESHQAQWIMGVRSLAQLLTEPQNQLLDKRMASPGADQTERSDELNTPALSISQNGKAAEAAMPIARELLPLVQQQLHTLETHQLTWSGQVWPGQEMQWEIQGQPEPHRVQQDERQWSTEIELALPKLGDVHARLVFSENGLKLALHAADSATASLFNRAMPKLQSALADIDIPLISAAVETP